VNYMHPLIRCIEHALVFEGIEFNSSRVADIARSQKMDLRLTSNAGAAPAVLLTILMQGVLQVASACKPLRAIIPFSGTVLLEKFVGSFMRTYVHGNLAAGLYYRKFAPQREDAMAL